MNFIDIFKSAILVSVASVLYIAAVAFIFWIVPMITLGFWSFEYTTKSFAYGNPFTANEAMNLCKGGIYADAKEYSEFYSVDNGFGQLTLSKQDYYVKEIRNGKSAFGGTLKDYNSLYPVTTKWYCLGEIDEEN